MNASRRKNLTQSTTDKEKTQLRALLGGISWHAQQVAPYLAAEVSLLLSEVSRSTVDTVVKSNILLATAKAKQNYKMKIHAFKESDDLTMVMWVDAANGNRVDGGSNPGPLPGHGPKVHPQWLRDGSLATGMALAEDRPHVSVTWIGRGTSSCQR